MIHAERDTTLEIKASAQLIAKNVRYIERDDMTKVSSVNATKV